VFVRLVSVPPTVSAFYRALFGGIALIAYLTITGKAKFPPRSVRLVLAAAALFFALDLWFWHRSILLVGPGLSTLLANLQVFFMILAGVLLFHERPRPLQLLAAPVAIAGLALILGIDWLGLEAGFRLGVVLGLLTAMSYAGYLLSMRIARGASTDAVPAVEVATVSVLVALLLGTVATVEGSGLAITSWNDFAWLSAYGVLAHALGLMLIASSLNRVAAAEVGIALLAQPALSLVWDILLFDRAFTFVQLIGIALTLLAIFLGSHRRVP